MKLIKIAGDTAIHVFAGLTSGTANRLVYPGMQDFAAFSGRVFNHVAKGETYKTATPKTWKSITFGKLALSPSSTASLFSVEQQGVSSCTPAFGRCITSRAPTNNGKNAAKIT